MQPEPCSERWIETMDAVAREMLGEGVTAPTALASAIQDVSRVYTRERGRIGAATTSDSALAARLCFFVPRDLPKVQLPLCELAWVGALPQRESLRVLDLGAGLGATSLGIAELAGRGGFATRLRVDAVDADSRALGMAARLTERSADLGGAAIELRALRGDVSSLARLPISEAYDLIVLGNVLNELHPELQGALRVDRLGGWLAGVARRLAPGGALVVLEPALRDASRCLQQLRTRFTALDAGAHLFAPCVHDGTCPLLERERDWCHQSIPLALAPSLARRARAAGLTDSELRFSYLTLTQESRSLGELAPDHDARRIVSGALRTKGKLELRLCGAGESRWLRRLDRDASSENAVVSSLVRGALIRIPAGSPPEAPRVDVGSHTRVERLHP